MRMSFKYIGERVVNGPGVVREGPRVDDDPGDPVPGTVHRVDEVGFAVGLHVLDHEAVDASHASEFFQVEGLMVDEGTSMADLKGLLDQFAHAMFGADRATRFRPGYYPFTEPSVAFDILCVICNGEKCPACSRTGWMTILGAGMVHPVTLRYGGIDPERYQGFAFGMGVERIANLRHAVADLRLYMEDDLRFLGAFR